MVSSQRDEKATRVRCVVAVIASGPGVDVDDAIRRDDEVASMTDTVGKDRRAKSSRQSEPAVIRGTGAFELCAGGVIARKPRKYLRTMRRARR